VLPINTSDYPTRARRPAYSVLDAQLLRGEYQISLPDWRSALATTLS
jgi:dTDP-4-dehydrorhamnose reductase